MPVDMEARREADRIWHERIAVAKMAQSLGVGDMLPLAHEQDKPYPTRGEVIAEASRRRVA